MKWKNCGAGPSCHSNRTIRVRPKLYQAGVPGSGPLVIVRNVIEYLGASTAGMLCSHICREAPDIIYSDRGSASSVKRSHVLPVRLRKRNLQADPSDRPNIPSKCGLSRCQPMPTPTPYSVQRTCWIRVAGPPNVSTFATISASQAGDRFGPLQLAQVIVVAEAERGNPPLAFEFAELKRLKREGADRQNKFHFDRRRNEVGSVAQPFRLRTLFFKQGQLLGHEALRERMPSM